MQEEAHNRECTRQLAYFTERVAESNQRLLQLKGQLAVTTEKRPEKVHQKKLQRRGHALLQRTSHRRDSAERMLLRKGGPQKTAKGRGRRKASPRKTERGRGRRKGSPQTTARRRGRLLQQRRRPDTLHPLLCKRRLVSLQFLKVTLSLVRERREMPRRRWLCTAASPLLSHSACAP